MTFTALSSIFWAHGTDFPYALQVSPILLLVSDPLRCVVEDVDQLVERVEDFADFRVSGYFLEVFQSTFDDGCFLLAPLPSPGSLPPTDDVPGGFDNTYLAVRWCALSSGSS